MNIVIAIIFISVISVIIILLLLPLTLSIRCESAPESGAYEENEALILIKIKYL